MLENILCQVLVCVIFHQIQRKNKNFLIFFKWRIQTSGNVCKTKKKEIYKTKFKNLVHNWEFYVESTSSPNPDYNSIVSFAADDFLGSISATLSHSVFAPLRED